MRTLATAAAALALMAGPALAQDGSQMPTATATLQNTDGEEIGRAELQETPSGYMYVVLSAEGLPSGVHGAHVHETGDCSADDFSSAGGHLAGDADHGILTEGGPHPGDLPNIHVDDGGSVVVEYFNDRLTMDMVNDDDGAAFIIHANPDDYESQPSGAAGDRLACGVFEMEQSS